MDDLALTMQLAATLHVEVNREALVPMFDIAPESVEWSINGAADPRGTLRVSCWSRAHANVARAIAHLAPGHQATRAALVDDDFEGVGLALRSDGPASVRWWALAADGDRMAERVRAVWPATAVDELLAAAGPGTCVAVGVELSGVHHRETMYVRVRDPAAAVRILELARVPVSRAANLFWKGLCGLEPGGRAWPNVWAARSTGSAAGWKFYYFARGDDLRRSDEVLLAAVEAGPELTRAVGLVGSPCIQLVGLTIGDAFPPAFTVYVARQ